MLSTALLHDGYEISVAHALFKIKKLSSTVDQISPNNSTLRHSATELK